MMSDLSKGEFSLQLPTGISPLEWSLLWCCRGDGRGLDWGLPLGLGDLSAEWHQLLQQGSMHYLCFCSIYMYKTAGHTDLFGTMPQKKSLHTVATSVFTTSHLSTTASYSKPLRSLPQSGYFQQHSCTLHECTKIYRCTAKVVCVKSRRKKWRKLILGTYFCSSSTEAVHIIQAPLLLRCLCFLYCQWNKSFLPSYWQVKLSMLCPL